MKIAVICSLFLHNLLVKAVEDFQSKAQIKIFAYQNFMHLEELFDEISLSYDGFVTSGPIPRQVLLKKFPHNTKPILPLDADRLSFYELFINLIYKYQDLEFRRAYIDFYELGDNPHSFAHYLSTGTLDEMFDNFNNKLSQMSLKELEQLEKQLISKHIKLYRDGEVDFTVTRFGSILTELRRNPSECYFALPRIEHIQRDLEYMIDRISLSKMQENLPGVIWLTMPKEEPDTALWSKQVSKLLGEYNQEMFCDFVMQVVGDTIELLTTLKTIEAITSGFTQCGLKGYLCGKSSYDVHIGYGIGKDISTAMLNAKRANRESQLSSIASSFLMNERAEMIGPLGSKDVLVVPNDVTPYVEMISKKAGLSTLTIQKLISAMQHLKTDILTPTALAQALNITVRSANRFLKKLVENQQATVLYDRQNSSKGRPERVYKILIKH